MGGIHLKGHFIYNEDFVRGHNLKGEDVAEYVRDHLEKNPTTIESYMNGRKKSVCGR